MQEFFNQRKESFLQVADKLKSKSSSISILRVFIFLSIVTLLVLLLKNGLYLYFTFGIVASFIAFGLLVNYHQKIKKSFLLNTHLAEINHEEVNRIDLKLSKFDSGDQYLTEGHPYSFDLDIFGPHSIYQLVSRCTTTFGKDRLAEVLQNPMQKTDIVKRQEAIKELTKKLDWRQKLEAIGKMHTQNDKAELQDFYKWLSNTSSIKNLPAFSIFTIFIWVLFSIASYLIVIDLFPFYWIFIFNIITAITLGPKLKTIQKITLALSKAKHQLNAVSELISEIESQSFESDLLRQFQEQFKEKNFTAHQSIKKLNSVVDLLNNRGNNIYLIANSFLMLDFFLLNKAEKWRHNYANHVKDWFSTLGQFEALFSFAAYSYAHPDYSFPELSDEKFSINGKQIGHPLIEHDKRVNNDFEMNGQGAISLITGSNMAGKSTFLRSLGVNIVLAQTGAPVCADSFSISSCKIFTSMRTKDNLEESISTFYAELLRINGLIKSIDEQTPTFFLLDEILKGTNSHDRHIGAQSLMQQLNQSNAFGLVSTHDVELHELTSKMKNFKNFSFHSSMVDGNLKFDYQLKTGPCLNFNAIELMKKMGISIS